MNKKDVMLEQLDRIEQMARDGASKKEIAQAYGISNPTLHRYIAACPEIAEAIDRGYRYSLPKVEAALYKAAVGYTVEEITKEYDSKSKTMVVTKVTTKEVSPNVQAIMNILKNKKGDTWNAAEKVNISGKIESSRSALSDVPTDDVARIAAEILRKKKESEE